MKAMGAALVLGMLTVMACKQPGEAPIDIDFGPSCQGRNEATQVRVYMLEGAVCTGCGCSPTCFAECGADNCVQGCDGGFCDVSAVESDMLGLQAESAGAHAIILEYYFTDDEGIARLGATACAEVQLDEDGTSDLPPTMASAECCVGGP